MIDIVRVLSKIHTELNNVLHKNHYAWIKTIVKYGNIKVEPEEDISRNRTVDFLITILDYHGEGEQKVAIEVEGDRKFDAEALLRRLKRYRRYPTIVIIPKENEPDAWRFQESDMFAWCWTATCRWRCRKCSEITTSSSSITPPKCKNVECNAGSNSLRWLSPMENVDFKQAKNNPSLTYQEIESKYGPYAIEFDW